MTRAPLHVRGRYPVCLGLGVHWWFAILVLEYHVSELLLVLTIEPEEFEFPQSFLLSRPYLFAMCCALVEFYLGSRYWPVGKGLLAKFTSLPGLCIVISGEILRKAAWLQARQAFTHRIKTVKRPGHELVTHGVYSICRHPGYLGWFIFVVGGQMLLANPICTVGFAVVSWRFFEGRIKYEDHHLARLFGQSFLSYKEKTPTLIPGIA